MPEMSRLVGDKEWYQEQLREVEWRYKLYVTKLLFWWLGFAAGFIFCVVMEYVYKPT